MGLSVSKERVDGKQNILDWKQTILIVKHEIKSKVIDSRQKARYIKWKERDNKSKANVIVCKARDIKCSVSDIR